MTMTLREQFRAIFRTLWNVLRVNPFRVYPMVYYGLVGRFTRDDEMHRRIKGWIDEANDPASKGRSQ